jgi:hypothetical protein
VVLSRLLFETLAYLATAELAFAVSPGEIEIAPKTLLEPDLLVYPTTYRPGTPWRAIREWWLAAEVFSPSSRVYDRDYKRDAYLSLGVDEVWLVDLDDRAIFVSRRGAERDVRHAKRLLWEPAAMPEPLEVDVEAVFRGVPRLRVRLMNWPQVRRGSARPTSREQLESCDFEMPVECERTGESFAPHHLEADRVNERESLIGEAVQPAEHRISREVRRNLDPFVDRIVQEVQHRGSCLLHIAQVQKVGMELAEDQRRTDELPARDEMSLRNVDGPRVMLIATA